jgi:hypothetical protein
MLIHTRHDMLMPRCAVALRSSVQNGMVVAWHRCGMACVNQTGKTQSKPLAAEHGMDTAWERHGMCELACKLPSNLYISSSPFYYKDLPTSSSFITASSQKETHNFQYYDSLIHDCAHKITVIETLSGFKNPMNPKCHFLTRMFIN